MSSDIARNLQSLVFSCLYSCCIFLLFPLVILFQIGCLLASGLLCRWKFIVPKAVLSLVFLSLFSGLTALNLAICFFFISFPESAMVAILFTQTCIQISEFSCTLVVTVASSLFCRIQQAEKACKAVNLVHLVFAGVVKQQFRDVNFSRV